MIAIVSEMSLRLSRGCILIHTCGILTFEVGQESSLLVLLREGSS